MKEEIKIKRWEDDKYKEGYDKSVGFSLLFLVLGSLMLGIYDSLLAISILLLFLCLVGFIHLKYSRLMLEIRYLNKKR